MSLSSVSSTSQTADHNQDVSGTRRSKRERSTIDYAKIEEGVVIPMTSEYYFMDETNNSLSASNRWMSISKKCKFITYHVRRLPGHSVTLEWAKKDGLFEPFMVPSNTSGFGLLVPNMDTFSVRQVAEILGYDMIVNVIDVSKQDEIPGGWTLKKWADYYESTPSKRKLIYQGGPLNVISLEFSNTRLSPMVRAPNLIRQLDWIQSVWPLELKEKGMFPKAQYYCLMSVAGCFTDFHIDFGGTSVWYHVLKGRKEFLLIPPTETNLARFESWNSSPVQGSLFFGDIADRCYKVTVNPGETLVIPSGWIHAVVTPLDSLVFGGNFTHSLATEIQFKCYEIERSLKIKERYSFPYFKSLMWFVASHTLVELRKLLLSNEDFSNNEIWFQISRYEHAGYLILIETLRQWYVEIQDKASLQASRSTTDSSTVSTSGSSSIKLKLKLARNVQEESYEVATRLCGVDTVEEMLDEFEDLLEQYQEEGETFVDERNRKDVAQQTTETKQDNIPSSKIRLKFKSSSGSTTVDSSSKHDVAASSAPPSMSNKLVLKLSSQKSLPQNTSSSTTAKAAHSGLSANSVATSSSSSQVSEASMTSPMKFTLKLPTKISDDIVCSVLGCCVEDKSQHKIPYWKRQVNGLLTCFEVEENSKGSVTSSIHYPPTWSLKSMHEYGDEVYPLCATHEEERYNWQIEKSAPPRFTSYLSNSISNNLANDLKESAKQAKKVKVSANTTSKEVKKAKVVTKGKQPIKAKAGTATNSLPVKTSQVKVNPFSWKYKK